MKTFSLLLLILLCGLFLRLDAAWTGSAENMPDSLGYEQIARGISESGIFQQVGAEGWSQPATNYSPGVPLLLGGLSWLSGIDSVTIGRIVLALLSSLGIVAAFCLGNRLRGAWAGIAAAAIVAFYPTLITDSGMILTEGLAGALLAIALLILLHGGERWLLWFGGGVVLALAMLVRPDFLLGGLVLVILFLWREKNLRPLLLLLGALIILAPWSLYISMESGRFVPISTGGGQTLFTGSSLATDGDPQKISEVVLDQYPALLDHPIIKNNPPLPGEEIPADQILHALALQHSPGDNTEKTLSRLGKNQYLEALSHPGELLPFLTNKIERTWLRGRESLTGSLPGHTLHLTIVLFALLGIVSLRRSPDWAPLFALLLLASLFALVFVASPRRVLAVWPIVAAFSGAGFVALFSGVFSSDIDSLRYRFALLRSWGTLLLRRSP